MTFTLVSSRIIPLILNPLTGHPLVICPKQNLKYSQSNKTTKKIISAEPDDLLVIIHNYLSHQSF